MFLNVIYNIHYICFIFRHRIVTHILTIPTHTVHRTSCRNLWCDLAPATQVPLPMAVDQQVRGPSGQRLVVGLSRWINNKVDKSSLSAIWLLSVSGWGCSAQIAPPLRQRNVVLWIIVRP